MKSKFINISGRTLALTGGRMLPPFECCELTAEDFDFKLVKRGFLLEQIASKPEESKAKKTPSVKKESI